MTSSAWASRTVAVALMACLLVVDPGGLAPAGPTRFAAFGAVLAAGSIVVAWRWSGERTHLRRFTRWWLVLLALVIASMLASADRWHAVFGTPERNLGALTWVGFAIAFAIGASLPPGSSRLLSRAATGVVIAMSGLALLEILGLDPTDTSWPGVRVGTPFAQSTYLAAALIVVGPLAASAAFDRRADLLLRSAAGLAGVAGLATLVATQSRGPILALGAVGVMALVLRGRAAVGIGVAGAATAAVVVVSLGRGWGTFEGRVDEWRIAVRSVRSNPVLGLGPEGYRNEFPRLVDADYVRSYGASVITDRAHNVFLDVAIGSGVAAAVALAALWVLVGRAGVAAIRDREASPAMIGLAVGVLAGLVQQLVLFPLAELDPIIWLFAGALVGRGAATSHAPADRDRRSSTTWQHTAGATRPLSVGWVCATIGAVAMVASFWWNLTSAIGEHRLAQSSSFRQDRAEMVADEALALRPQSVRLAYAASLVHAGGPTLLDLDEAITVLERSLQQHPNDPALRSEYVFRLVERARRSALPQDADRAAETAAAAIAQAPNSPRLLGANAEALLLGGERDQARDQVLRALELDPDDPALEDLAEMIEKS